MADPMTLDEWLVDIGGITEGGRAKLEKATIVNLISVKLLTLEECTELLTFR